MTTSDFSYIMQFVVSLAAIAIPRVFPFRLLQRQYGLYGLAIILIMSLLAAYLNRFIVNPVDSSVVFFRVFFLSCLSTLVILFSEVRAMNAIILARSEFIHETIDNIVKVHDIVEENREV